MTKFAEVPTNLPSTKAGVNWGVKTTVKKQALGPVEHTANIEFLLHSMALAVENVVCE